MNYAGYEVKTTKDAVPAVVCIADRTWQYVRFIVAEIKEAPTIGVNH